MSLSLNDFKDKLMETLDDLTVITIKAADSIQFQTTYGTIKSDKFLCGLLEKDIIETNIESSRIRLRLKHLRSYYCTKLELEKAVIEDDVKINIGGKIYSLPKMLLVDNFEYFRAFFDRNSSMDPDYSSVVIDRCYEVFDEVLKSIRCEPFINSVDVQQDLDFYAHKNKCIEDVFHIEHISFIAYDKEMFKNITESLETTNSEDDIKYSYKIKDQGFILWQFQEHIAYRDLDKYCKISMNDNKYNLQYLKLNNDLKYDENLDLFFFVFNDNLKPKTTWTFSKKINVKMIGIYERRPGSKVTLHQTNPIRNHHVLKYGNKTNRLKVKLREVVQFTYVSINGKWVSYNESLKRGDITIWFEELVLYTGHAKIQSVEIWDNDKLYFQKNINVNAETIDLCDSIKTSVRGLDFYISCENDLIIYFQKEYEESLLVKFTVGADYNPLKTLP